MFSLSAPAWPASPPRYARREQRRQSFVDRQEQRRIGRRQCFDGLGQPARRRQKPENDPDELYDFVMSEGVGYPDLVRAWSETCGRAVDWLISSGVKVDENAPGRVWLDQSGEISLAPVYKKDVGTRALAKLKERFFNLGGRYLNGVAGRTVDRLRMTASAA